MMKPVADFAAKQLGHCPMGLVAFPMQDLKVTVPGAAATWKEVLENLNYSAQVSGPVGMQQMERLSTVVCDSYISQTQPLL